jgi:hypothetical protein
MLPLQEMSILRSVVTIHSLHKCSVCFIVTALNLLSRPLHDVHISADPNLTSMSDTKKGDIRSPWAAYGLAEGYVNVPITCTECLDLAHSLQVASRRTCWEARSQGRTGCIRGPNSKPYRSEAHFDIFNYLYPGRVFGKADPSGDPSGLDPRPNPSLPNH